jgi:hypothetical protein
VKIELPILLLVIGMSWAYGAGGETLPPPAVGVAGGAGTDQVDEDRRQFKQRFKDLTPEQREQMKDFIRTMRDVSPEQRAQEASKHPFFKQLPVERQQAILDHLQKMPPKSANTQTNRWSPLGRSQGDANDPVRQRIRERWKNLSPEQKQQIREFSKNAKSMTPEQRREAMNQLPFFRDLTPEENQVLQKRLQRFKGMDPDKRKKMMENYERWQKMTPEEREAARQKLKEKKAREGSSPSQADPASKTPAPSPVF